MGGTFKIPTFFISIKSQGQSLLPFYGSGYKDLERSINLTIMGQLGILSDCELGHSNLA